MDDPSVTVRKVDPPIPETHNFRCRACGHNHTVPSYCETCNSPICPNCGRANQIMNLTEMSRMVSDAVPTGKPSKRQKKKQTVKNPQQRIDSLLAKLTGEKK